MKEKGEFNSLLTKESEELAKRKGERGLFLYRIMTEQFTEIKMALI